jgi:hemolysin III
MRSPTSPESPTAEAKPLLRGRIHQVAFFTAIPAGIVLVWLAPTARARLATLAFALAMVAQFGVSAMYHIGRWSQAQEDRMRQLDHSMIFVLIAGSYTPFCLLVLHGTTGTVVLAAVWAGAAVGISTKLYRVDLHVLSGFMYIGLGWVAAVTFPSLVRALDPWNVVLLVTGGVLYTVGALVLVTHWPDPWPRTFGYHEVWHVMTVLAATCHFIVILRVVLLLRA